MLANKNCFKDKIFDWFKLFCDTSQLPFKPSSVEKGASLAGLMNFLKDCKVQECIFYGWSDETKDDNFFAALEKSLPVTSVKKVTYNMESGVIPEIAKQEVKGLTECISKIFPNIEQVRFVNIPEKGMEALGTMLVVGRLKNIKHITLEHPTANLFEAFKKTIDIEGTQLTLQNILDDFKIAFSLKDGSWIYRLDKKLNLSSHIETAVGDDSILVPDVDVDVVGAN